MTPTLRCPFCSSDKIYCLLNTLHCKRCKNMWHREPEGPLPAYGGYCEAAGNPVLRTVQKTDPLEKRLAARLDEYRKRYHGTFCMDLIAWKNGDISADMFRRYLRTCVKQKILTETKDRHGRTWYSDTGGCRAGARPVRSPGDRSSGRPPSR